MIDISQPQSQPASSTATATSTTPTKPEDHLTPVRDLSKIFPDIEGQLCSRHSTLFGKLKNTFNKLYDNLEPTHYIVVKGRTHIIGSQDQQVQLSMALENGIILLLARTYEKANVYINGNHLDEEIIMDSQGAILEGLCELSGEMQAVCQAALSGLPEQGLYGGIIYIHANIPEGFYNYANSFLTALFLSSLAINNSLSRYPISHLITLMSSTRTIDQLFLQKQFYDYQNRSLCLSVGPNMFQVPLDPSIKLLFCRLDLATCDIKHSRTEIQELRETKEEVKGILGRELGVGSFYEMWEGQVEFNLAEVRLSEKELKNKQQYQRLIESQLSQLKILCQYSNSKIPLETLLQKKWYIDSNLRNLFSQQVIDLVHSIRQKTGIKACTIVENEYLMLAIDRRKYTELICVLRQLLHKGELKSKSCFKIEEELVETRWGHEENGVGEKIFGSVPSKGIAVFEPTEAIWFD